MSLARCLRRVSDGLRGEPPAVKPTGELALLCKLCAGEGTVDGAAAALRDEVLTSFEFPWLSQFALAQLDPIDRRTAAAFVARFTGSNLGDLIGDAMRASPDSDATRRLRAVAVRARGERPAQAIAARP